MTDPILAAVFGKPEPVPTITEYQREQLAIRSNYERLKAERLAREASNNQS